MSKFVKIIKLARYIKKRPRNANEIKAKFGLDHRTTCRYIEELRAAGFVIESASGPNGGYWLRGERM